MAIDIKNLKDAKLEDLHSESATLAKQLAAGRGILKAINDEITVRENLDMRVRHVENLSDEELSRMLTERTARRAKAQGVTAAGNVKSGETVDGLKS